MESSNLQDLLSKLSYTPKVTGPHSENDGSYQMLMDYQQMHKNRSYPEVPQVPQKVLALSDDNIVREFDYLDHFTNSEKSPNYDRRY
jgi:hypothetical protein